MAIMVSTFNKISPVAESTTQIAATQIASTQTQPASGAATSPSTAAVGTLGEQYPMKQMGRALLDPAGYLVPFELVSVLLLAVMIGAAYLAKGRRAKSQPGGAA